MLGAGQGRARATGFNHSCPTEGTEREGSGGAPERVVGRVSIIHARRRVLKVLLFGFVHRAIMAFQSFMPDGGY